MPSKVTNGHTSMLSATDGESSAMENSYKSDGSDDYKPGMEDSDFEMESAPAAKKEKSGTGKAAKESSSSRMTTPKTSKSKKSVESEYKKMPQLEHILARPDTYIGSIEPTKQETWVFDTVTSKMVHRRISFVPGLYKIFDEILVNAADNKQRDKNMTKIDIVINAESNEISILNDGKGIPVVIHKEHNIYVPTLIFGHLLTSSNYNDEERKVTGGRNGYGAKLCNVYSTKFTIETASSEYKKKFKQTWTNNMHKAGDPKIDDLKSGVKDFTKITFQPDLARFKMDRLDEDTVALLTRRAYDIAGTAGGVKVTLNGERLPVKDFKEYVGLYTKDQLDDAGQPLQVVYEKVSPRWEIALTSSDTGALQQVSFVNSIATMKGGKHVDHVVEPLADKLKEAINKKNKMKLDIKPNMVKSHLWVFVNCLIENPAFDSQTKETMTLPIKSFGSKCVLSEKFIGKTLKMGIVENIMSFMQAKAQSQLSKKLTGGKTNKLRGIAKLEDANDAGTKHSRDCTLILTEGDSAKALVVSGFSVVGRDKFGVFPLRGKLLNVRDASVKQVMENIEINNIIKILGLQHKKKYETPEDLNSLRYGRVMIMTDQDPDGSHIKGLLINFIHNNWPGLIKARFVDQFITPIVKVTRTGGARSADDNVISFYSLPEFEQWKQDTPDWAKWKVKYYKGLGTSTAKEAKEYFADTKRHRIQFRYGGKEDDENIQMAFSKTKVEERKVWLTTGMQERKDRRAAGLGELYLYQHDTATVTYSEFVNKELILFSNIDNERSIPSLMDGLKPGQRKVLFTCLKRNDKREVKVAQLAGSVAELSAYHHGEQSLMSTIVNLAQDFVGANNINILMPHGQFGTRLQGGNDSASPRYIFTMLSPLARVMFPTNDEPLLHYLTDDNQRIEPEWYCPILPLVLVNGAEGIGTGWSTKVPNYNPLDIVENIRLMMNSGEDVELKRLVPWYRGFRGSIQPVDDEKFLCDGEVALIDSNWIEITELPIGVWTQNYKEKTLEPYLTGNVGEKSQTAPKIADYKEYHTDTTVRFTVKMTDEQFRKASDAGFHNYFKLRSFINTTSMVLFDAEGCLQKYKSAEDILRDFFRIRLRTYKERKEYLEKMLQAEADKLANQARFILEKISGDLKLENVKRNVMHEMLKTRGYDSDPVKEWKRRMEKEQRARRKKDVQEEIAEAQETMIEDPEANGELDDAGAPAESTTAVSSKPKKSDGPDYDYLGQMAIYSLTLERKEELIKQRDAKQAELVVIQRKTARDLWNEDLDKFLEEFKKQELRDAENVYAGGAVATSGSKKGKAGGKRAPATKAETRPSADAERVVPQIDASIKMKVEATKRAKTARAAAVGGGSGGVKSKKMKFDPDDEFAANEDERALVEFEDGNNGAHETEGDSSRPLFDVDDKDDLKTVKAKKPAATLSKTNSGIIDATAKSRGGAKTITKKTSSRATNKEPKDAKGKKSAAGGRKRKNSWASDDSASDDETESDADFSLSEDSDDGGKNKKTGKTADTATDAVAPARAAKKKAFASDDEDDDVEELMPKPKNRAIPSRSDAASAAASTDKDGDKAASKPTKKKVVNSDDDADFEVEEVMPKPKSRTANAVPAVSEKAISKPAKKKAFDSDDDADFEVEEIMPKPKSRAAPSAAADKAVTKPTKQKVVDSEDEDEIETIPKPKSRAPAAAADKAPSKPAKKKPVNSDDDDDFEVEEIMPKPKSRTTSVKPAAGPSSKSSSSTAATKITKSKTYGSDDDDSNDVVKMPRVEKKKKVAAFADDETDEEAEVMPQPKKRAAPATKPLRQAALTEFFDKDDSDDDDVAARKPKKAARGKVDKKHSNTASGNNTDDDARPAGASKSAATNKKPEADALDDDWSALLTAVGHPSPKK